MVRIVEIEFFKQTIPRAQLDLTLRQNFYAENALWEMTRILKQD